jgi:hypothetical protein
MNEMNKKIEKLRLSNEIDTIKKALESYNITLVNGSDFPMMHIERLRQDPPSSKNVVFLFSRNNEDLFSYAAQFFAENNQQVNLKYIVVDFNHNSTLHFPVSDSVDVIVQSIRRNLTQEMKSCGICYEENLQKSFGFVCKRCSAVVCEQCTAKLKIKSTTKKDGTIELGKLCPYCRDNIY